MSAANLEMPSPEQVAAHLQKRTLEACQLARKAAGIVAEGIATGVASLLDGVREREKELEPLSNRHGPIRLVVHHQERRRYLVRPEDRGKWV